jgi:hypothetical protein
MPVLTVPGVLSLEDGEMRWCRQIPWLCQRNRRLYLPHNVTRCPYSIITRLNELVAPRLAVRCRKCRKLARRLGYYGSARLARGPGRYHATDQSSS